MHSRDRPACWRGREVARTGRPPDSCPRSPQMSGSVKEETKGPPTEDVPACWLEQGQSGLCAGPSLSGPSSWRTGLGPGQRSRVRSSCAILVPRVALLGAMLRNSRCEDRVPSQGQGCHGGWHPAGAPRRTDCVLSWCAYPCWLCSNFLNDA